MSQDGIWLDDLMARDVAVEWFESVALIQVVCKQIIEEGGEPDGFPTAGDLLLKADGSIHVFQVPPGEAAAPAAARMILSLGSSAFPVQLRLALSQTAAGEPAIPTLSAFSDTLRFFERPNHQEILRHLYERTAAAAGRTQAAPEVAPVPPVQDKPPARAETPKEKKKRRRTGRIVAAAVIVAAASVSLMFVGFGGADTQMRNAMGAVREKLGRPSSDAASEAVEKPSTVPSATRETHRPRKSGAPPRPSTGANATGESSVPAPRVPSFVGVTLPALKRGATEFGLLDEIVVPERDASALEPAARVYSLNDSGVRPPRPIYPQLPDPESTRADSIRKGAAVVELLIGTDGLVERVKLRTAPRTIHDVMLLSAAKAWRFDPASVDGAPVRFLYRVAIVQ